MKAPVSASLGAMGSLVEKLDLVLDPQDDLGRTRRLPKGVKNGMHILKEHLEEIGTYLHDLLEVDDPPLTAKSWMKQVRELSYDIEDYIDRFAQPGHSATFKARSICKTSHVEISGFPKKKKKKKLKRRKGMADMISEFGIRAQEVIERHERYELGCRKLRRRFAPIGPMLPTPYEEGADLVIDGWTSEFIDKLANDWDEQLKVVSVVGSGGIGKTTLARVLYNKLRGQFDCRAFVKMNQNPDIKIVVHDMLTQLQRNQAHDDCHDLDHISKIREYLQDKRYLIIVDDLWAAPVWDIINNGFPEGSRRSRIIITTQIDDVALACCCYHSGYVFEMRPLDVDHSRKLFFNRFVCFESDYPQEFKEISYKIVEKCGGFPLATINMASLLASQPVVLMEQWTYICDSLSTGSSTNSTSEGTRSVINLSYNNLTHYLKTCLLYLNMYPEGCTICKDDLVKQWVAEGFIGAAEGRDMEKVAESYFDELVGRRFLQPARIKYNNEVVSCTVHDMVRDLIAYKSAEENFIMVVDYCRKNVELSDKVHRLSIHFGEAKYAKTPGNIRTSQVRSLTFFGLFKCMPSISEFKLLCILNLKLSGHNGEETLDLSGISELFQLIYFKVASDVCIELPKHMQGLQNLETLDIDTKVTDVPWDITHLPCLLHLRLPFETNLMDRIGSMRPANVQSLGKLTNLQDLRLTCSTPPPDHLERNVEALGSLLGGLGNLKTLALVCDSSHRNAVVHCPSEAIVSWDGITAALQRFEWSPCRGSFSRVPKWIGELHNLCILKIAVRELLMDGVDVLRGLPALTALSLYVQTAPVERIVFGKAGFSVLKYFKFRCSLPRLKFEEDAMPKLRKLKLVFNAHSADQNDSTPISIEHLSCLKEISAKIGAAGADPESVLTAAVINHPSNPIINVQSVDWILCGDEDIKKVGSKPAIMTEDAMVSASSGVMNSLLGKLTTLMGEEYGKLKGVRKEVACLEDEFRSMNALLKKLAGMDELDDQVKEWRNRVREMSYDIEDCIDDFMHHLGKNGASAGFVNKTARVLKKLRARHQIANKIQEIKARVKEADERRKRYKLDEYIPTSSYVPVDPRVVAMYADAAGLVGIDAPRDELVELLMGEEQELKVVSIVGFGGLGKTTVANEVYRKLEGQFKYRAFVSVSQKPDIPRLLNKVLSELGGQCSRHTGELDDFLKDIRKHLQDKRYFVIIDDLWDSSAWNIIKCAFPENNRGSRVLTTTRIISVAVACCSNSKKENIYDMRPLDEGDSRRLFFGRIFGSGEACPDLFEDVSTDILKRCGGLPLAIISISSLLAGQSKTKWEYLRKSLGSMFNGNPTLEDMRYILDLSYKNLPPHLKTCLLYVGMYPKDYKILKTDLVRQWIAEGFVSEIHGLDAEDVAESYFNELINRSMIQPVRSRTDYNDEVLFCRIHDIMLDLIRSKSAEENFIDVIDEPQVARGAHKKIRRVSLQYDGKGQVIPATISGSPSHVRSVVIFGRFFKTSFVEFKYVRVLHLDVPNNMEVLDLTGMCRLFLLRYLKIVQFLGHEEILLPSHIGELRELETMDLGEVDASLSIPSDIAGLPRLSHLIVPEGTVLPDGICRLTSLRTLGEFDLTINSVDDIERLHELTNMRDLRLFCCDTEPSVDLETRMDALHSSLKRLPHFSKLRHFDLRNDSSLEFSLDGMRAPRHLRTLQLSGCLFSRIPECIAQLHDLYILKLTVREVSSKEDGVGTLAVLPSLARLWLEIEECPEERVIISGTGVAFRALKNLLFYCPKPFLTFEAGAMPRLQTLELKFDFEESVGTCVCVPVGIEHLPAGLRQVHVKSTYVSDEHRMAHERNAAAVKSVLRSAFTAHHPGVDVLVHPPWFDDEPWFKLNIGRCTSSSEG